MSTAEHLALATSAHLAKITETAEIDDRHLATEREYVPRPLPAHECECGPFFPHMKLEEVFELREGDKVDHRDEVGRCVKAEILERKGTVVKIHYIGWNAKWDCYSDLRKEVFRFAHSESISKRPAHRFAHKRKGDRVDVCPKLRHSGVWFAAEIRQIDTESGQVQVVYEKDAQRQLYWTHLDDATEIDEFKKKSATAVVSEVTTDTVVDTSKKTDEGEADHIGGGQQLARGPISSEYYSSEGAEPRKDSRKTAEVGIGGVVEDVSEVVAVHGSTDEAHAAVEGMELRTKETDGRETQDVDFVVKEPTNDNSLTTESPQFGVTVFHNPQTDSPQSGVIVTTTIILSEESSK